MLTYNSEMHFWSQCSQGRSQQSIPKSHTFDISSPTRARAVLFGIFFSFSDLGRVVNWLFVSWFWREVHRGLFWFEQDIKISFLFAKIVSFICLLHFSHRSGGSEEDCSQKGWLLVVFFLILLAAPCCTGLLYVFEFLVIRCAKLSILDRMLKWWSNQVLLVLRMLTWIPAVLIRWVNQANYF